MGAINAELVIVGQDFCGSGRRNRGKRCDVPDPTLETNKNLMMLLDAAGIDRRRVYLTNAILCIKPGNDGAAVLTKWITNCQDNLRRTIEIVHPLAVAALGGIAWRAAWRAMGRQAPMPPLAQAVGTEGYEDPDGPALFALYHCGKWGTFARDRRRQAEDWNRLGAWLGAARERQWRGHAA